MSAPALSATLAPEERTDARQPWVRLQSLFDDGDADLVAGPGEGGPAGAVAARGRIRGVPAVAFATDPRVQGGALGAVDCQVLCDAYQRASADAAPVIGIWQSGGARLREGARSLHGIGRVFAAMVAASGRIPQLSLVLGPAAGGAAYGPALTDIVVLAPAARVFVTGPDVIRSVTGEETDALRLGGPAVHGRHSGVAHVVASDEADALARIRRLVGLLGRPATAAPLSAGDPDPGALLPARPRRAYDVRPVVQRILDGPGEELHPAWAPNLVTILGRLHGRTIGVLATNPLRLAGCLDAKASDKGARFVRLCDSLGVPLLVLVDVPGYLPGISQEYDGIVRRGAKLVHAFAAAEVPRVTVITRKAYGGAFIALNSRSLGATRVFAWSGAEVDVMSATAAVRLLSRRELAAETDEARPAAEAQLAVAHLQATGGLARAVADGIIDEVIEPGETRARVAAAFAAAPPARGRLTNIPL
ncbi:MAG: acyl-CoA carboxylase subunit beta [Mycobacteriales bacterium]